MITTVASAQRSNRTPVERVEDPQRLERLERLAHLLDDAFEVPGTNLHIGWDALIGLVPGLGDAATGIIAAYIVQQAQQMGVSRLTLARMMGNVVIDLLVGAVPLLGDVFDVAFKANLRNLKLLRRQIEKRSL